MSKLDSIHGKLEKVRKPRVHVTYDVETEGSTVKKELPFVVGVMSSLSGNASSSVKDFKERKFTEIDGDSFDEVMSTIDPALSLKVKNTLTDEDGDMAVDLKFSSMDDFTPDNIIEQVEPLKKLKDAREKLIELLSKADRSENLENILETILKNNSDLSLLSDELKSGEDTLSAKQESDDE